MNENSHIRRIFLQRAALAALLPVSSLVTERLSLAATLPLPQTGMRLLPGIERIVKAGVLRTGFIASENPPFFHTGKDGVVKGVDAEMVKGIAQALNVKLVVERDAKTFGNLFERVVAGNLDLAFCKLSRTVARAMSAGLTQPYVEFHHAAAFNRERLASLAKDQEIGTVIKSFSGSMGVVAGTTWGGRAKSVFPASTIVEYPDWELLVEATRIGKVMACYRDEFEIKKLFKAQPELSIAMRGVILTDSKDSICGVVAPERADLMQVVNTWLDIQNQKYDVKTLLAMF